MGIGYWVLGSVLFVYRHILLFLSQRHIFLTGYFFNLVHPVGFFNCLWFSKPRDISHLVGLEFLSILPHKMKQMVEYEAGIGPELSIL